MVWQRSQGPWVTIPGTVSPLLDTSKSAEMTMLRASVRQTDAFIYVRSFIF